MEGLHEEGIPAAEILAVQGELSGDVFDRRILALLVLAEKVTLDPAAAHLAVEPALEAGWSREEVAHAIFVATYYNMLTRIAEAFALPPDASHPFDPELPLPWLYCEP